MPTLCRYLFSKWLYISWWLTGSISSYMYVKTAKIARLDLATSSWTKLGDLKTARSHHGVIFNGEVFLVAGGRGNLKTEKCTLSGNEF